ncbi:MAG: hypothetical protein K0Q68_144 [Moraxellaceae bacterium]|jgi:hypothetical protein|nr:hypothetical protein [Moraxellaceae bacterium]
MLEMKAHCEKCGAATPATGKAHICSFECTFCPDCATVMQCICPNCRGNLVPRPTRMRTPAASA